MNVSQIKEKYTCLDYLGQERVIRKTNDGYLCRCPWRQDEHPSLSVTPNGKGWYDFVTGKHGNLIDMVMLTVGTTDLGTVCAQFGGLSSFTMSNNLGEVKEKKSDFAWLEVGELRSKALYAYLNSRKINTDIAKQFLKEAHYSFNEKRENFLYSLAYGNDRGGWELRSSRFKGSASPKGITTHWYQENAATVVFEGFMDMLSFATLCSGVRHNYIVLNSIVNADAAIDILRERKGKIFLCLDNDEGGRSTTKKMLDTMPNVTDISDKYAPYKDINEYLFSFTSPNCKRKQTNAK